MALRFLCFNCSARIKVPDGTQGRKVKCPSCGALQRVPDPNTPPPEPTHEEVYHDEPAHEDAPQAPVADVPDALPVAKPAATQSSSSRRRHRSKEKSADQNENASSGYASSMKPPGAESAPAPESEPTPASDPVPQEASAPSPQVSEDSPDLYEVEPTSQEEQSFDPLAALAAAADSPSADEDEQEQQQDQQQDESQDQQSSDAAYELVEDSQDNVPLELQPTDDMPEPVSESGPELSEDQQASDDEQDKPGDSDDSESLKLQTSDSQETDLQSDLSSEQSDPHDQQDAQDDQDGDAKAVAHKTPEEESPALPWTDVNAAAIRQDHEAKARKRAADQNGSHSKPDEPTQTAAPDASATPNAPDKSDEPDEPIKPRPTAAPVSPKAIPLGHASTFRATMARPQPVPGIAKARTDETQAVNQGLPAATVPAETLSNVAPPPVSQAQVPEPANDAGAYDQDSDDQSFDDQIADNQNQDDQGMEGFDLPEDDIPSSFEPEPSQEAALAAVGAVAVPVAAVAAASAAGSAANAAEAPRSRTAAAYGTSAADQSAGARPRGLYRSLQYAVLLLRIVAVLLLMLAAVQGISWQRGTLPEVLGASGYRLVYALQVCIPLGVSTIAWGVAECCAAARELLRR